jgi:hypothetical protein
VPVSEGVLFQIPLSPNRRSGPPLHRLMSTIIGGRGAAIIASSNAVSRELDPPSDSGRFSAWRVTRPEPALKRSARLGGYRKPTSGDCRATLRERPTRGTEVSEGSERIVGNSESGHVLARSQEV